MSSLFQTVITFVVILGVLVFFHELGHFWVAKLFKMRVEEFALGFGKRLARVGFDGQTEYNIRALPLGGFVRIAGMDIEDAAERRLTGLGNRRPEHHSHPTETTNAHLLEQEVAEVSGAEDDGFNTRPIYQRFLVILAGPIFSLLLGWLVLCLIGTLVGLPVTRPTGQVDSVVAGGPAARAGMKAGDTIVALNGAPVRDGEALIDTIHASANRPLRLTVEGAKQSGRRELVVTPRPSDMDGKQVGLIGIQPHQEIERMERLGLVKSFQYGSELTVRFFEQLAVIFQRGQVRENLGGPIAIFQGTRMAVKQGGATTLLLAAQLSLSLGIFNLLPIPVLDGGHLALLTLEAIRGRKLTAEQMQRVFATGLAIIAVVFLLVMFNDITRLFRGG